MRRSSTLRLRRGPVAGLAALRGASWLQFGSILVVLLGLALSLWVSTAITERIPHTEDELAFVFQSKVFGRGALWAPAPPIPAAFFAPFVVERNGRRFAKYPPGYPLLLAPASLVGAEWLMNPLFGAAAVALIVGLGAHAFGVPTGLLAGLLAALSPFFLEFSGSLMSHPATLVLVLLAIWCYMRAWERASTRAALSAGALFGLAFLSRPVTALGVAAPFALHALGLSLRGRGRAFGLPLLLAALPFVLALPLYNWALTGQARLSLYDLWWSFDRYGFGDGIGTLGRHTPAMGWSYVKLNLIKVTPILLGWPLAPYSAFALFAMEALVVLAVVVWRPDPWPAALTIELLLLGSIACLVVAYIPYWAPDPRYYYESLGGFYLLSALGATRLLRLLGRVAPLQALGVGALASLMLVGAVTTMPAHLNALRGKNYFTRARLDAVQRAGLADALVFVVQQRDWSDYGSVFPANSPWLDGSVVYALDTTAENRARLRAAFPDRTAYLLVGTSLQPLH